MVPRIALAHFLVSLFLFTSFTAAWPWPPSFPDLDSIIIRRQDDSKSSATSKSQSASQGSSGSGSSQPTKTAAPSGSAATTSGASNSKSSGSRGSKTAQSGSKTSAAAQASDVDPRLPAGGVNMITPNALAQTTYYKIGDTVSFAWNYTSLSIAPSKVDILVSCSANSATYTLSSNASFESTGSVMWDTAPDETGTAPLLTETYTLVIHDAAKDVTAVASAGRLGSYNQFYFGMYVPQPYTPAANWTCAVCSAALSDSERQALKFMSAMCVITVMSFTWFVGGFGAFL